MRTPRACDFDVTASAIYVEPKNQIVMTKKHFIRLAEEYKYLLTAPCDDENERDGIIATINATIRVIRDAFPNFDEDRFRKACGI